MKDVYYFSHDSNARRDPKMVALMSKYGAEGYGVFFILIEIMSEQHSYKIEKFPKMADGLSKEIGIPAVRFTEILAFIITECELLRQDDRHIWSESLMRRKSIQEEKRQARVEAGRIGGFRSGEARGSKTKQNEAPLQANEADLEATNQSKVKHSKSNERKGGGEADPPTLSEVRDYREAEHLMADPDKFHHYQSSKGWPGLVDWKAAFRYWDRTEFPDKAAPAPSAPRHNPADDHQAAMDLIDRKNAWENSHTPKGKCSFCGGAVKGLTPCGCAKRLAAYSKEFGI